MKILITGSTGFIGGWLFYKIQNETSFELQTLESDLRQYNKVAEEIHTKQPNLIIHLAARTEVEKSFYEPMAFSEVNYLGTVNLVEAALKLENLDLFVFASTMETYGWQPVSDQIRKGNTPNVLPVFDEQTPQNPNAAYSVAKVGCERYIEYMHRAYGLPYCILRQTNTYGRTDNDFFVVEQIITQMLKNKEVNLGYPEPYRNFLYIEDLINAYSHVIEHKDKINARTFTLGPPNAIQIQSLANKIANKIGWQGEINWYTKPARPGEIYLLNSSFSLIKRELDWQPNIDLDTGLDKTINYWQKKLFDK